MTAQFTIEQRGFGKALVLAYGNATSAIAAITILAGADESKWPGVPTERTINGWRANPEIVPAVEILEQFGRELQLTVGGQMRTILDPLHRRILATIASEDSSPSDINNLVQAYTRLVDKVQPRESRGGVRFEGPTQLNAPGSNGIMRLFGLKEIEAPADGAEIIEGEVA